MDSTGSRVTVSTKFETLKVSQQLLADVGDMVRKPRQGGIEENNIRTLARNSSDKQVRSVCIEKTGESHAIVLEIVALTYTEVQRPLHTPRLGAM